MSSVFAGLAVLVCATGADTRSATAASVANVARMNLVSIDLLREWGSSAVTKRTPSYTKIARKTAGVLECQSRFCRALRRDVKCGVRRGHSGVDRQLQQHLLQIALFELVRQACPDVQPELLPAPERGRRREHQKTARTVIEARPRPDPSPGKPGDQLLEIAGEVRRRGRLRPRARRVRLAGLPCRSRSTPSGHEEIEHGGANERGRSRFEICAAGRRTASAPAMTPSGSLLRTPGCGDVTIAADDERRRVDLIRIAA